MEDSFGDRVLNKTLQRVEKISDRLTERFGGVKPFDKEAVSEEELLYQYEMERQNPNLMLQRLQKDGWDKTDKYIYDLEQLKLKRRK